MSNSAPQGNSSSNRIPAILLFLAAIGVPSAAGLTFAHTITQNPWFALGLGILYELAIVVVATVGKVWQKLESPLVDHTAEWVNSVYREFSLGIGGTTFSISSMNIRFLM